MTSANVPIIGLETSHSSIRSSSYDQQYDQIPFDEMVDEHHGFVQGMSIHPPDHKIFLYMDASHYDWEAHLEPMSLSFHGRWSECHHPNSISTCWK